MDLTHRAIQLVCTESERIHACPTTTCDAQTIKALEEIRHTLVQIQHQIAHEKARHITEKDILRAELHCEAVDREANAARISDRQRFLFERAVALPGQAEASDRAAASASYVEAALASLCPHNVAHMPGCEALEACNN